MDNSRKKPGAAFWTTVGIVAALVGYVLSYAYAVRPQPVMVNGQIETMPSYTDALNTPKRRRLESFFTPIHWVDRRLRPRVWVPVAPF